LKKLLLPRPHNQPGQRASATLPLPERNSPRASTGGPCFAQPYSLRCAFAVLSMFPSFGSSRWTPFWPQSPLQVYAGTNRPAKRRLGYISFSASGSQFTIAPRSKLRLPSSAAHRAYCPALFIALENSACAARRTNEFLPDNRRCRTPRAAWPAPSRTFLDQGCAK